MLRVTSRHDGLSGTDRVQLRTVGGLGPGAVREAGSETLPPGWFRGIVYDQSDRQNAGARRSHGEPGWITGLGRVLHGRGGGGCA
jgi:hypothetical protein